MRRDGWRDDKTGNGFAEDPVCFLVDRSGGDRFWRLVGLGGGDMLMGVIAASIDVFMLLVPTGVTVYAEYDAGLLEVEVRRFFFLRQRRKIAASAIREVKIEIKRRYDSDDGHTKTMYRVVIVLQDGSTVPLGSYASGRRGAEQLVKQLRTALARFPSVSREQLYEARVPMERQGQGETEGVRWTLSRLRQGESPIYIWHSDDFRLPENDFIYLAQKRPGGALPKTPEFLPGKINKGLLLFAMKPFGIGERYAPNLQEAVVAEDLPAHLEAHFTALTSNAALPAQLINPWGRAALENWAGRYVPGTADVLQTGVLIGLTGVWLYVFAHKEVNELPAALTDWGVDLVRNLRA